MTSTPDAKHREGSRGAAAVRPALLILAAVLAVAGWWLGVRLAPAASALLGLVPIAAGGVLAAWAWARSRPADGEDEDRHLLRSILDNLGEGVSVADETGRLVLFNPTAKRILGQDRTDSGPGEWSEVYGLFRPDTTTPMPMDELPLARAVAGKESRDVEMFVRSPMRQGGVFIRVTATPLRDRDGRLKGGVAVFRDITDRKWSETVLRDSEARFRSIVESTPSALIIVSPSRRIVEFNPEAERIFRKIRAEALGKDFLEFCLPDEFRQAVADDVGRALAGQTTPGFETPILASNSAPRTILWSFSRLTDAAGEAEAVVAIGHDVTDRREADEALRVRELAAHLQSAREGERKHVAREIHDELGQALTGLKFEVSFLSRRIANDPELRDRLERIEAMIDETIGTVRGIAAELRPQILDQLGLCEAIRWQAQEFHKRTGMECTTQLPEGELECGSDLSIAMFRILQESLTNAARHAEARHVAIRVQRQADRMVLEVTDDGRGITQDELSNARSFGLLGMQERARMFGGTVRISRGEPAGTTVRLDIPC